MLKRKQPQAQPGLWPEQAERQRQLEQQQQRLEARVARIEHEILIISGKGGVGKSTVATNLAWALAKRDFRVGLLDADIHGPTIPLMLGLRGKRARSDGQALLPVAVSHNLHVMSIGFLTEDGTQPLIWRGPLRANVIRQFIADVAWGDLDFLIVDLPPGTGDEPLTVAQSFPDADGAIVVTTPQEASLSDCRKAVNFVRAVNLPVLGVIENMSGFVCPHCGRQTDIFAQGGGQRMAAEMAVAFLGALPLVPEIVRLGDAGKSALSSDVSQSVREPLEAVVGALLDQIRLTEAAARPVEE